MPTLVREASGRRVELEMPAGDHITKIMEEQPDQWYERAMLDDWAARAPRGTALDVGACFGTHSVWLAALGLRVVALEPNPAAYKYLERNVRDLPGIHAIQAAAGNRAGRVQPKLTAGGNLGSTMMRLLPRDATEGIPMITVDSLGIEDCGLIKIDVEGMEDRVLEGAEQTIRRCQPLVYVEAKTREYTKVLRIMRGYGYRQIGRWNRTPTYGFAPISRHPTEAVKLSAAVMAHHKRERHIPYLQERMGADVQVIWDERENRWDTGRRAMLAYDPEATHHLVVQDDAILPRDFIAGVERAAATVPDNPICFYVGKVRPNHRYVEHMVRKAMASGVTWAVFEGPWWGPAVVVPTRHIDPMIAACDKMAHIDNYDRRLSRYFLAQGLDCYYSVPSLVSHRTGPDEPSLVVGRGSGYGRVAFQFIGEEASALEVEWTLGAVYPERDAPQKVSP